jgi:hypothetical protein
MSINKLCESRIKFRRFSSTAKRTKLPQSTLHSDQNQGARLTGAQCRMLCSRTAQLRRERTFYYEKYFRAGAGKTAFFVPRLKSRGYVVTPHQSYRSYSLTDRDNLSLTAMGS